MKSLFTFLMVVLVSLQVLGQKKGKVDPKDLQIDSLTKASSALAIQLDSTSTELTKYYGVYTSLKEKVFKNDFEPTRTSALIDSLRSARDSTFALSNAVLQDSLVLLKSQNSSMQAILDSIGAGSNADATLVMEEKQRDQAIADLKELKELLDNKIITQAEFDDKKKKLLEKL